MVVDTDGFRPSDRSDDKMGGGGSLMRLRFIVCARAWFGLRSSGVTGNEIKKGGVFIEG